MSGALGMALQGLLVPGFSLSGPKCLVALGSRSLCRGVGGQQSPSAPGVGPGARLSPGHPSAVCLPPAGTWLSSWGVLFQFQLTAEEGPWAQDPLWAAFGGYA